MLGTNAVHVLKAPQFAFTVISNAIYGYIFCSELRCILLGPWHAYRLITFVNFFQCASHLKIIVNTNKFLTRVCHALTSLLRLKVRRVSNFIDLLLAKQCTVLMTLLKSTSMSILKIVAAAFFILILFFDRFELANANARPDKV